MFAMACFYVSLLGSSAPRGKLELPGLSASAFVSLAVFSALLVNLPVDILLLFLQNRLCEFFFVSRYPQLSAELDRRKSASAILASISTYQLLAASVRGSQLPEPLSSTERAMFLQNDSEEAAAIEEGVVEEVDDGISQDDLKWGSWEGTLNSVVAELGNLKKGKAPPGFSLSPWPYVAACTFLFCASVFFAAFVYSFSVSRGSTATLYAAGSWGVGVLITLILLRPLEEMATIIYHFSLLHSNMFDGKWASHNQLTLYFHTLAMPEASSHISAKSPTSPFFVDASNAVASLAPVPALVLAWCRGASPLHTIRAALCEVVYVMAREKYLGNQNQPPTVKLDNLLKQQQTFNSISNADPQVPIPSTLHSVKVSNVTDLSGNDPPSGVSARPSVQVVGLDAPMRTWNHTIRHSGLVLDELDKQVSSTAGGNPSFLSGVPTPPRFFPLRRTPFIAGNNSNMSQSPWVARQPLITAAPRILGGVAIPRGPALPRLTARPVVFESSKRKPAVFSMNNPPR